MAAIGIILGLIGAAVGIVAGVIGGLVGLAARLLACSLALLFHMFPVVLMTIVIVWMVMGSNARNGTGAKAGRGDAARPQSPGNSR